MDRHGFSPKRVERCEEDSLFSLLTFSSSGSESCSKDRVDVERTNPLSCSHQCVLELHEYKTRIFGTFAMLEPRLVASFMNVLKPILLREFSCLLTFFKCFQQFWTHRIPMNCSVNFSFILIIMAYQSHEQRRDSDFKRMSTEGLTGRNVLSLVGMISFV